MQRNLIAAVLTASSAVALCADQKPAQPTQSTSDSTCYNLKVLRPYPGPPTQANPQLNTLELRSGVQGHTQESCSGPGSMKKLPAK